MTMLEHKQRIVFWGTYDIHKPRVRLLIAGAKCEAIDVFECHFDLWQDHEDKSQIKKSRSWLGIFLRALAAYPILIWKYLSLPTHDTVIVSHPGYVDILVLWLFARLRWARIIWDASVPL